MGHSPAQADPDREQQSPLFRGLAHRCGDLIHPGQQIAYDLGFCRSERRIQFGHLIVEFVGVICCLFRHARQLCASFDNLPDALPAFGQ